METLTKSHVYFPEIQGLRAIAVILVIIFHSELGLLPGGFVGVDVFFVISGFLITGLLLKEFDQTKTINLTRFYASRIRRLLPAATIVVLAITIFVWFIYSPLELKMYSSSAVATVLYLSNAWFASLSTDYLAEDTHTNPLLHTWSLSVEEQFYLIWPLLILLMVRRFSGSTRHQNIIVGLSILCLVSFISSLFLTGYSQPWAFFSSPTRAWEFGSGGLIAIWVNGGGRLTPRTATIFSLLGITLLILASALFNTRTPFPGFAALIPVVGSCLLISSAYSKTSTLRCNAWLKTTPMQLIGDMSYSLYLWHWPVFVFLRMLAPEYGVTEKIAGIFLSVILASITYRCVENPFRYGRFFSKSNFRSICLGGALLVSSTVLVLFIRTISANELTRPEQERYLTAKQDLPKIYKDNCHQQYTDQEILNCAYGNTLAAKTIVLFGDSHAAHWFPALEKIALSEDIKLISLTKSGCPSVSFEPYLKKLNRPYTECSAWREKAFGLVEEIKPHAVIISNHKGYLLKQGLLNIWREGLDLTLSRLENHSSKVIVIHDTPELDFEPAKCLSRAAWKGEDASTECIFNVSEATSNLSYQIEERALARIKNGALIDMTDVICENGPCAVERANMILYIDSNHISATFSGFISRKLKKRLAPLLNFDAQL